MMKDYNCQILEVKNVTYSKFGRHQSSNESILLSIDYLSLCINAIKASKYSIVKTHFVSSAMGHALIKFILASASSQILLIVHTATSIQTVEHAKLC